MMSVMRKQTVAILAFLTSHLAMAASSSPSVKVESTIPQFNSVLVGLDLEFLVPDNLAGLSLAQTLTGAHLGASIGDDTLQLSAFYGSNQETSTLVLSEVDSQPLS
jgi:hypothetical protein